MTFFKQEMMVKKKSALFILLFLIYLPAAHSQQEDKECYGWHEIDTYPIYMDTISFRDYILHNIEYPYPDGSFQGRFNITFNIDTCGQITEIEFKRDMNCRPCVKNILHTLRNAKRFTPATKNNKPVCSSIIIYIPYGYEYTNRYQSPFFWHLSPKDSSIVDVIYTDLELTDFLEKELDNKNCTPLDMLDELPVYQDTISFEDHIYRLRKPLSRDYRYRGRYVISVEIDTLGNLSNIQILDDNADCDECLENVYEILQTAKSFLPGKKDGKVVSTSAVFAIPYNERFRWFLNPLDLHLNPQGGVVDRDNVSMHKKMILLNKNNKNEK